MTCDLRAKPIIGVYWTVVVQPIPLITLGPARAIFFLHFPILSHSGFTYMKVTYICTVVNEDIVHTFDMCITYLRLIYFMPVIYSWTDRDQWIDRDSSAHHIVFVSMTPIATWIFSRPVLTSFPDNNVCLISFVLFLICFVLIHATRIVWDV